MKTLSALFFGMGIGYMNMGELIFLILISIISLLICWVIRLLVLFSSHRRRRREEEDEV